MNPRKIQQGSVFYFAWALYEDRSELCFVSFSITINVIKNVFTALFSHYFVISGQMLRLYSIKLLRPGEAYMRR